MQTDVLYKLIYEDDLKEMVKSETKFQGAMDHMSQACDIYDLTLMQYKTQHI